MRTSLLPTGRDLTNTAVSAVIGVAAGVLVATERRRYRADRDPRQTQTVPDDPAWHAAVAIGRVRPDGS